MPNSSRIQVQAQLLSTDQAKLHKMSKTDQFWGVKLSLHQPQHILEKVDARMFTHILERINLVRSWSKYAMPASSAILSAQLELEAISLQRRSAVVRGAYEAFYQMRPAVGPSYGLFVERSADPIDNPARPQWPLPTVHTTRAQNQINDQHELIVSLLTNKHSLT